MVLTVTWRLLLVDKRGFHNLNSMCQNNTSRHVVFISWADYPSQRKKKEAKGLISLKIGSKVEKVFEDFYLCNLNDIKVIDKK